MKIKGLLEYVIWVIKSYGTYTEDYWGEWETWEYWGLSYSNHIAAGSVLQFFNKILWSRY
jgi:hypothetical protein